LEALKNPDSKIRPAVIDLLARIHPVEDEVVDVLDRALKDPDPTVRLKAAIALGLMRRKVGNAVKTLLATLKTSAKSNLTSFLEAVKALDLFGPAAEDAVETLLESLDQGPPNLKEAIADVLSAIVGSKAKEAADHLIKVLQNANHLSSVRIKAAAALGLIGSTTDEKTDSDIVDALVNALTAANSDVRLRQQAIKALGRFPRAADKTVTHLAQAEKDPQLRMVAVEALGRIRSWKKGAVEALLDALDSNNDPKVRDTAEKCLVWIGERTVPLLKEALEDGGRNVGIHRGVAGALGKIGATAKTAVPALVDALSSRDPEVSHLAAHSLGQVVAGLGRQDKDEIAALRRAPKILTSMRDKLSKEDAATFQQEVINPVQTKLDSLEENANPSRSLPPWAGWPVGVALYVTACLALWSALLWLRPLWLLHINDSLKAYLDFTLPAQLGGMKVLLRDVLLVRFFNYHPRVLDAWVARYISAARESFQERDTVKDRQVYVGVPVELDGQGLPDLTVKHLQRPFGRKQRCLLIWGEGGVGKTRLACQVARWAMAEEEDERLCSHLMLAVLIEQELEATAAAGPQPLLDAIGGQLRLLIEESQAISPELIDCLLRQRRLLVVVDHLSEMSEATRKAIRPGDPTFPANALVVTSRIEEKLDGVAKTIVRPQRIQGDRLSSFLEAYLTNRGKRFLFPDPEYFSACGRLSQMVRERNITVLLAKLFAEQMIALKEGSAEQELPDNIPDLMLSYLNELNRGATANDPDDRTVHATARIVAWECLRATLLPKAAALGAVLTALGGSDANRRLDYLKDRLRLVRTIGPAKDQIRFALDPLAEYLAGLHLVEDHGAAEEKWRAFLQRGEATPGGTVGIKGFLLAVRDCCSARGEQAGVPAWVPERLGTLADLGAGPVGLTLAKPL
jgi:HEAT repeat protein